MSWVLHQQLSKLRDLSRNIPKYFHNGILVVNKLVVFFMCKLIAGPTSSMPLQVATIDWEQKEQKKKNDNYYKSSMINPGVHQNVDHKKNKKSK